MGNIVINPNSKNNEFKRKTVFDNEIINIIKNVKVSNDTSIPYLPKEYYKHQMQACCINALYPKDKDISTDPDSVLLDNPTNYLRIPLPILNDVDCSDPSKITKSEQDFCLNTTDVNIAFRDDDSKGNGLCPTQLDISDGGPNATNGSFICDSLINNSCAKELYDQKCMSFDKNDKLGYSINVWNQDNQVCNKSSRTKLAAHFVGSPICACSNSQLGPNTNTNPSKNLSTKLNINAYGINDANFSAQTDTPYSLNINNNTKVIYPKHLDSVCATGLDAGGGAYKITNDYKKVNICMNQLNITNNMIDNLNVNNISQTCSANSVSASSETVKNNDKLNPDKVLTDNTDNPTVDNSDTTNSTNPDNSTNADNSTNSDTDNKTPIVAEEAKIDTTVLILIGVSAFTIIMLFLSKFLLLLV